MKKVFFILIAVFICSLPAYSFEKEEFDKILKKAESGDPVFQYKAALSYMFDKRSSEEKKEKNPDYKSAFFWLMKSAQEGHLESQYLLSMLYELGKGTKKDYKKALYWYKKAVENEKENAVYLTKIVKEFVKEKDLPAKFKPLKKYLHEPFKIGSCLVCHVDDDSNPSGLIAKNISELCYKCHPRQDSNEFDHEPVKNGRCTECHDPHQSDAKPLLKGSDTNDLCLKCHDRAKKAESIKSFVDMNKKFRHKPADESCTNCHKSHTSKYEKLLKAEDSKMNLCFECHKDIESHKDFKSFLADVKYKHSPVQNSQNRCLECHDVHASDYKKLLKTDLVSLCLSCHDKPIKTDEDGRVLINISEHLDKHPNWHKPIKEYGCIVCHDSHGSKNFDILKKPFQENFDKKETPIKGRFNKRFYENFNKDEFLCFKCHKNNKIDERINRDTNFRDGDVNLHYIHVNYKKGRACIVCHDAHASKYSHLIRDNTLFGNARFPLRHIVTENGGSCAPACHEKAEYDRIKPKGIGFLEKRLNK